MSEELNKFIAVNVMGWQYVKDHPNRALFFCSVDGKRLRNIKAKVWRLHSGEWAYAVNSDDWKDNEKFFLGEEPSKKLAIETCNKGMGLNAQSS